MGPCQDSPQFPPVMHQAAERASISEVLADKGYDAEHNHVLCREKLGIPKTNIAVRRNTNRSRTWPSTPYRRSMKRRKNRVGYGQRWQAETAFSTNKRVLGTALKARKWRAQKSEIYLRVLTHNLLLVAGAA